MKSRPSDQLSDLPSGTAPVAVLMITLNEAHNIEAVCQNLQGWAQEVFIVDSFSRDDTVDIALRHGVTVVQRRFRGFGDQWNFALNELPVEAPWTMKLDPDERLDEGLKESLKAQMLDGKWQGITVDRHLWFMGRVLPIQQRILRAWQTGACRFSDVAVNEHPLVDGSIGSAAGILRHHDSPDLDHWLEKQNRYTSAEAVMSFQNAALSVAPRLFGDSMQRRMWLKKHFSKLPGRFFWLFLYYWLIRGTWRAGWVGYAWARLRTDVMRLREYKRREIELTGNLPTTRHYGTGSPDKRVQQFD